MFSSLQEKVEDLGVVPALRAHELAPMSIMDPRVQPPAGELISLC